LFTISVQNHRQPLSGNKLYIALLFVCLSCFYSQAQMNEPVARKFKVQLLLPLSLDEATELKGADVQWQKIAVSYYQGILLALDSLERSGFKVQLFVDDYKRDTSVIKEILSQPSRQDLDLIIGPLYRNGFAVAERFSAKNKIPLLSPLLTFQTASSNPYSIAANPTIESYGHQLANFINTKYDSCNVVLVHDNSKTDKSFSKGFKEVYANNRMNILQEYTHSKATHAGKYMSFGMKNLVIVPSNDERTVNAVLYQVNDTIADKPASVFGIQSWLDLGNVNYKVWDTVDVHLLTPYYLDYDDSLVKQFVLMFRQRFAIEPDEYATRGYDQFMVMMSLLRDYGKEFVNSYGLPPVNSMHTSFELQKKSPKSALENGHLNLLRFHEFRFHKLQ
jgi:ABC-type branched-subunit amino acid transport system substrate-binding protein